jgi:hypothetical protein
MPAIPDTERHYNHLLAIAAERGVLAEAISIYNETLPEQGPPAAVEAVVQYLASLPAPVEPEPVAPQATVEPVSEVAPQLGGPISRNGATGATLQHVANTAEVAPTEQVAPQAKAERLPCGHHPTVYYTWKGRRYCKTCRNRAKAERRRRATAEGRLPE